MFYMGVPPQSRFPPSEKPPHHPSVFALLQEEISPATYTCCDGGSRYAMLGGDPPAPFFFPENARASFLSLYMEIRRMKNIMHLVRCCRDAMRGGATPSPALLFQRTPASPPPAWGGHKVPHRRLYTNWRTEEMLCLKVLPPAPLLPPGERPHLLLRLRHPHWRSLVTYCRCFVTPPNAARAGLSASRGRSVAARATSHPLPLMSLRTPSPKYTRASGLVLSTLKTRRITTCG